jgi:DNA topoisomerase IB
MTAITFEETEEGRVIRVDVPNLDCMEDDDLRDFWSELEIFRLLSEYAEAKGNAQYFRRAGSIGAAQKLERHCETLYLRLPAGARW